jgi:ABC-type nickel/cobalt efflux system permease component RcnA
MCLGIALTLTLCATLVLTAAQPMADRAGEQVVKQQANADGATASRTERVDYLTFPQLHIP